MTNTMKRVMRDLDFQTDAIRKVTEHAVELSQYSDVECGVGLNAPTGSGKSYMIAESINGISNSQEIKGVVFIVATPGAGGLKEQLKNEIMGVVRSDINVRLMSCAQANFRTPRDGDVYVASLEELYRTDKDGKFSNILTRESETANYWTLIQNAARRGYLVVIIRDESHHGKSHMKDIPGKVKPSEVEKVVTTSLARFYEETKNVLTAYSGDGSTDVYPLCIDVTATPRENAADSFPKGFYKTVEVDKQKVRESGLVRVEGVINCGIVKKVDAIVNDKNPNINVDHLLIDASIEKKRNLDNKYAKAGSKVKALIGIQIKNGKNGEKEEVLAYLKEKHGVTPENGRVAVWLDKQKDDSVSTISNFDSPVEVLLYKEAIVKGWNCPRFQVLVGLRRSNSDTFNTQNVGRMTRSAEGFSYIEFPELNRFYIFSAVNERAVAKACDSISGDLNVAMSTRIALNCKEDILAPFNALELPTARRTRQEQTPMKVKDLRTAANEAYLKVDFFNRIQISEGDPFARNFRIAEGSFDSLTGNKKDVQTRQSTSDVSQNITSAERMKKISGAIKEILEPLKNTGVSNNSRFSGYLKGALTKEIESVLDPVTSALQITKSRAKGAQGKKIEAIQSAYIKTRESMIAAGIHAPSEANWILSHLCSEKNKPLLEDFIKAMMNSKIVQEKMPKGHKDSWTITWDGLDTDSLVNRDDNSENLGAFRLADTIIPRVSEETKPSNPRLNFYVDPEDPSSSYTMVAMHASERNMIEELRSLFDRHHHEGWELVGYHQNSTVPGTGLAIAYTNEDGGARLTYPDFIIAYKINEVLHFMLLEVKPNNLSTSMDPLGTIMAKAKAIRAYGEHVNMIAGVVNLDRITGDIKFVDGKRNENTLEQAIREKASERVLKVVA